MKTSLYDVISERVIMVIVVRFVGLNLVVNAYYRLMVKECLDVERENLATIIIIFYDTICHSQTTVDAVVFEKIFGQEPLFLIILA